MNPTVASIACTIGLLVATVAQGGEATSLSAEEAPTVVVVDAVERYCIDCHGSNEPSAGLDLKQLLTEPLAKEQPKWEKVIKKLRTGQMPPHEMEQPPASMILKVLDALERPLDQYAKINPQPGRTQSFRRLTRAEYKNSIRDILSFEIDVTALLPTDELSHGFDNITVGELSPTLVNRYLSAARKISRDAIGTSSASPGGKTYRVRPDVTQEQRIEGLPIGTRGGTLISHTFPQDGEYEIRIRLSRDRDEHVEGLSRPHKLELLLDRARVKLFTVIPPSEHSEQKGDYGNTSHEDVDRHLVTRIKVKAGLHKVGVTFLKENSSLLETRRQPLNVHYNMYRHPRLGPAVFQVSITGPFGANGPGDTASRQRIFVSRPSSPDQAEDAARQIVSQILRRAIRRPIEAIDLTKPMELFHETNKEEGFENGVEMALSSILVHPEFLFRVEKDPTGVAQGTVYTVSDVELASRLSFFLWSSVPDEELLDLAERGRLKEPEVLAQQTRRMLADPKSQALIENFAGQWLYLRNLDSVTPDGRLYPDFGDNLRQAFRRETELYFENILREDRRVLELLRSDYTFLNERLAKHYGIPHVYGTRFRRVALNGDSQRGGLLRHGSILSVTSYATRTSPVLRGKWVLENILGTPSPPPPPNIPALEDNTVSAKLSVRKRLAEHRANATCASCHNKIDPVGFALENFDAVGRWRELEKGQPVDASGGLPDGCIVSGVGGLEQGLLARPNVFLATLTEKLMTFALGRGIEYYDAPAIRKIVREAEADDGKFSTLILAIVRSDPFQMRMTK